MSRIERSALLFAGILSLAACEPGTTTPDLGFLAGTDQDPQIGLVVHSGEKALTLFQLGAPTQQRKLSFGASESITPTGFSVRGTRAAVPLGNAASVAVVDLTSQTVSRIFLLPRGNATGSAWADDRTVLVANLIDDYVGRFTVDQTGDTIRQTVEVAPAPTAIVVHGGRAYVVSGNLDENYSPLGNGVVTVLDPANLRVVGTVDTGGRNPLDAAVGPDGKVYVIHGEDFSKGTLSVIDPVTLQATALPGFGAGPGSISIDRNGLAYVSGFFFGTLVWNTRTRQFVRGPDNPVCARLANGSCRGSPDADVDRDGNLYQVFFGSARQGLSPWVFRYRAGSYELTDSLAVGQGPYSIQVQSF